MEDFDFNTPLVLDNGTHSLKAGLSGENEPSAQIRTIIGSAKHTRVVLSAPKYERSFGDEAIEKRGLLKLRSPMVEGQVANIQDMTMLWEHLYKEVLKNYPAQEHPVLISEPSNNPIKNRSQIADAFFNSFDVPRLFFAPQCVLSLISSGRLSGCVLSCGHGVTQCVPICDGFSVNHAITTTNVAGDAITKYFQRLLKIYDGLNFHTSSELVTIGRLKEDSSVCEVLESRNVKSHSKLKNDDMNSTKVQLPDGKVVTIGSSRFRAPEVLFDPSLIGMEYGGLQDIITQTIQKCDLDLRSGLYSQILLSGGSTLFKGFGGRLLYELKQKSINKNAKIRIYAPKQRQTDVWVGGSILASLQNLLPLWIKKSEFEEHGTQILLKKSWF